MAEPLVSIVVITYNSSKFVHETLESCKAQTYKNIELIISDDASSDDTVQLCKEWIEKNKDRFVRSKVIESGKNTGIAPNLNRGIKDVSGEWVKILAGDDYISSDLVEKYIAYTIDKNDISILHSNAILIDKNNRKRKKDCSVFRINQPNCTADEQFEILLRSGPIIASSAMVKTALYKKVGFYDERATFWEDTPFWIKVTKAGVKLTYLNYYGTYYRRENSSVQNNNDKVLYNKFQISKISYRYKFLKHLYPITDKIRISVQYWAFVFLYTLFKNKKNIVTRSMRRITNELYRLR
ncbi:glycosyltransferase family 2 protein [Rhodohalobacter sp. 614A]|uniref:glycosyltransferase family 2 protein n=1 Tax=Rhodohalobacter sp. 614A TaxID=2908649 RepID=UPI001F307698|nr:glycosyltransferase [Rhodohalobacter sp. 614A]